MSKETEFELNVDEFEKEFKDEHINLKSRLCYDLLYQLIQDECPGFKEVEFPSYEAYLRHIEKGTLPDALGFVPGAPGARIAGMAGASYGIGRTVIRRLGGRPLTQENVMTAAREELLERANKFLRKTMSGQAKPEDYEGYTSAEDDGDGGTSEFNYDGGSKWNSTGLSTNNKPVDVKFNTDIAFTGILKYFLDGRDKSAPLIMKYGVPGILSRDEDSALIDLFDVAIWAEWNREISKRIVVNKYAVEIFTASRILNMFNTFCQVLATYYFWQSVIAYTDDKRNRNEGMLYLRGTLTSDEYLALYALRRAIDTSVIPPFLHTFMHKQMANYKQSHLPGSPLMKIMPLVFKDSDDNVFREIGTVTNDHRPIRAALDLLQDESIRGMQDVMARAFPAWCNSECLDYVSSPYVDPDFTTMFVNMLHVGTQVVNNTPTLVTVPAIQDFEDAIVYNLHTDAPDGFIMAMQGFATPNNQYRGFLRNDGWMTGGTSEDPGTLTFLASKYKQSIGGTLQTCRTSHIIYDAEITPGFHPVELVQKWQALCANTYALFIMSPSPHAYQKFGTERVINMDVTNVKAAAMQFMNLMYTEDLMATPAPGKIQQGGKVYNKSNSGSRKSTRGRRGNSKKRGNPSSKTQDRDEL